MNRIEIQLSSKVVNADLETRQQALTELSKALRLNGSVEAFDMHKAAKGERITAPHLNPAIWELEKEFFALWDPEKIIQAILVGTGIAGQRFTLSKAKKAEVIYKANGEPLSDQEMDRL